MRVTPSMLRLLTEAVVNAFRDAVRLGLPIYAEPLAPGVVNVETENGEGEYLVTPLLNPLEEEKVPVAVGVGGDNVVILVYDAAEGRVIEERLDQVPYALATRPSIFPDYKADVWANRLRSVDTLEPCDAPRRLPGEPRCPRVNPCEVAYLDEYGVVGWYDMCTGIATDSRPWQARFGLRPPR